MEIPESLKWRLGYAADPAIDILLDKSKIAQIKVAQLDAAVNELETALHIVKMTRSAIAEQYKIK